MDYKKPLLLFISLLSLETIIHIYLFGSFQFKQTVFLILFTLISTIFFELITSMINKKINKILYIFIILLLTIIFIAQLINFKFFGNIFSVYSLFNGGQVFEWFGAILKVIIQNKIVCLLLIIPLIINLFILKYISFENTSYKDLSIKLGIFFIIFLSTLLLLNIDTKNIYSAKNLYFYKHAPNQIAQKFGIMTSMRLDVQRILLNFEEKSIKTVISNTPIKEEVKYNQIDINFEELINNTNNEKIKNIDNYFSTIIPSEQNEYTGIFKGKNLINIVAESFSPIAVNSELTPTLYMLVNNGFVFNNFYTPVYYVSTSDGEYVTLNSLLPKENTWSFSKSSKNYLPYSYGNVFKELNYTTYAFHNGRYKYYDRNKSHPNLGYKYMACGNGLEKLMNCNKWPQSDVEMIDATFQMYANDEQFVVYYMSISGHLEYNFYGNNMAYKNRKFVENIPFSTAIKAYLATQIELDRAINNLLKMLEEKGILDDTVIVLSADHYPYGLTMDQMKEANDLIVDEKFDIQKNHLVIWNNQIENQLQIDKYSQSLDILPTLLNLFGVEYDSRLLMGSDILSSSEGLVILNDRSFITEYGKYDATSDIFTPFKDKIIPDNYLENINALIYNKFIISSNILDTNYYQHVFKEEA